MFTGIIEDIGRVRAIRRAASGARVAIETVIDLAEVAIGDSIAVNGACLTAVTLSGGAFEADVSAETLARTTLADARPGQRVNLELALRLGGRLGGHLVQGHVDGVGRMVAREPSGAGWLLGFELPEALLDQVIEKGSVAIDGVSLTIATLRDPRITVAVVPHTADATTLGDLRPGARVNVETDLVGKYVRRALQRPGPSEDARGLTLEALRRSGLA